HVIRGAEHVTRLTSAVSRFTHHAPPRSQPSPLSSQPLFYPAWEILPHEDKLPHSDVISERLETLIALTHHTSRITPHAPLVVTSVAAILQRSFPRQSLEE